MTRILIKEEYLATFVEPMRRLGDDESYRPIRIGDYVSDVIVESNIALTRNQLEVRHVYLNGDKSFYHVLIYHGLHNEFLVVVVDCERGTVHGHYFLNLNHEYGMESD